MPSANAGLVFLRPQNTWQRLREGVFKYVQCTYLLFEPFEEADCVRPIIIRAYSGGHGREIINVLSINRVLLRGIYILGILWTVKCMMKQGNFLV